MKNQMYETYGIDFLPIESIIRLLKDNWFKERPLEWAAIFWSGIMRIEDQTKDNPPPYFSLDKLKEEKLKSLNELKKLLIFVNASEVLYDDIEKVERKIESWEMAPLGELKIEDTSLERFVRSSGLKIITICNCDNYKPCSTQGVINLNCANCGGSKPQTRY